MTSRFVAVAFILVVNIVVAGRAAAAADPASLAKTP